MRPQTMPALRLLAVTALLAGAGGCAGLDTAAAAQGSTGGDLAAGAADRLSASAASTYTATYRLAGGGTATVAQAQDPARTLYDYPGGRLVLTPAATTTCTPAAGRTPGTAAERAEAAAERTGAAGKADGGRQVCTLTAALDPASPQPADLFVRANRAGLVPPSAVLALLNAVALDSDEGIRQNDTTIAGQHATCIRRAGAGGFTACITTTGVLGSFTGKIGGTDADLVLTHFSGTARTESFTATPGATVTDRRTR